MPPSPGRGHTGLCLRFLDHRLVIAVAFIAARFAPWEITGGNVILRSQSGMTHEFPTPESGQLVVPGTNRRGVDVADGLTTAQRDPHDRRRDGRRPVQLRIDDAPRPGWSISPWSRPRSPVWSALTPGTTLRRTRPQHRPPWQPVSRHRKPRSQSSPMVEARHPSGGREGFRPCDRGVTTSGLADATPAGFLVHADDRYQYAISSRRSLRPRHDVLMGGNLGPPPQGETRRGISRSCRPGLMNSGPPPGYHVIHDESDLAGARDPGPRTLRAARKFGLDGHGPQLAVTTRVPRSTPSAAGRERLLRPHRVRSHRRQRATRTASPASSTPSANSTRRSPSPSSGPKTEATPS